MSRERSPLARRAFRRLAKFSPDAAKNCPRLADRHRPWRPSRRPSNRRVPLLLRPSLHYDDILSIVKILRLRLTNFLSFRQATLELGQFTALIGPNAAGKSNAVAALKLLHEIPLHGLPLAIARRGGFDQLRHRSRGRPYDPAIGLDFQFSPGDPESHYDLALGALPGGRYEVKSETATVRRQVGTFSFRHKRGQFNSDEDWVSPQHAPPPSPVSLELPPGTSAVTLSPSFSAFMVRTVLDALRTVAINPARVAELQDPSSTTEFETDGSNTASIFEQMDDVDRQQVVAELGVVVPTIERVEPQRFSDKLTLLFSQRASGRLRGFLAKQMSDGTLRAFSQILSLHAQAVASLVVVEEPEIAIHLAALRSLVEILQSHSDTSQVLITTHSADIVDSLSVDELRVVWNVDGASHISSVAEHTKSVVTAGLISPGELLRSDALDPAVA